MPYVKYSTRIEVSQTIMEIEDALQVYGADQITKTYDTNHRPNGMVFSVKVADIGYQTFRIPVNIEGTARILNNQHERGYIPQRAVSEGQPERIAWRVVREWIIAQLAMIEVGVVALDQIMLPYMLTDDGRSVYDRLKEGRFQLALSEG